MPQMGVEALATEYKGLLKMGFICVLIELMKLNKNMISM